MRKVLCKVGCVVFMELVSSMAVGKPTDELWSPAAFGVYPAWEAQSANYDVRGFRFNLIAGRHRSLAGLDIGTFANICDESCTGVQFACVCNVVGNSSWLAQFSGLCNYSSHDSSGLQLSLVNWGDEDLSGVLFGGFNCAGVFHGVQVGVLNSAESGAGLQMGVVNVSGKFTGVQFGLLNVNLESSIPVLPVLNAWV